MSKFPDPPINTEFSQQGQSSPIYAWEQWFQTVTNGITSSSQGFSVTHAQRLKLTQLSNGSTSFEIDTGHVFIWFGKWIQLV